MDELAYYHRPTEVEKENRNMTKSMQSHNSHQLHPLEMMTNTNTRDTTTGLITTPDVRLNDKTMSNNNNKQAKPLPTYSQFYEQRLLQQSKQSPHKSSPSLAAKSVNNLDRLVERFNADLDPSESRVSFNQSNRQNNNLFQNLHSLVDNKRVTQPYQQSIWYNIQKNNEKEAEYLPTPHQQPHQSIRSKSLDVQKFTDSLNRDTLGKYFEDHSK